MKKALLAILTGLVSQIAFSQEKDDALLSALNNRTTNYNITSIDLTIIEQSVNYYYINNTYNSNYGAGANGFYGNVLATKQAQYDYNYKRVSQEYGKLLRLELINIPNQTWLNKNRKIIQNYVQTNSSNVDFGNDANAESYIEYITQVYKVESIRDEIKLLHSINNELIRIKNKDPDNFYKSERYTELGKALSELRDCEMGGISKIAWKYGLL
jgi:hypothetical protein